MNKYVLVIAPLLALISTASAAETAQGSGSNLKGDILKFNYDVVLRNGTNDYCLPHGTRVRVLNIDETAKTYDLYRVVSFWGSYNDSDRTEEKNKVSSRDLCSEPSDSSPKYFPFGQLATAKLNEGGFIPDNSKISGFNYGVLLVPFKYYFKSQNLIGAATVAPYMGYHWNWNNVGVEINPIGFVGATSITGTDSSGDNTNLFGVSYGLGLLMTLKSDFNAGVTFGVDRVSKNDQSSFSDNGHTWFAISLGYNFGN